MAAKQEKFTLTLDFNVERGKLQEISNMLGKDLGKGLHGSKTQEYFSDLKRSVNDFGKTVNNVYSELQKPLVSKSQAKELATTLETAFKGLDTKLLSLQGNIGRTFNSASNVEALKQIRQLGNEIDKLTADYQAASQLFSKSRSLGNKGELKSRLSVANKELDILNKKQTALTTEEKKQQVELKKTIDDVNAALAEKARLSEQINQIQSSNKVNSQAEFSNLISSKIDEQSGLINGSISIQDANTLKDVLSQLRDIIKDIYNTSNATGPKILENINNIEKERQEAENQAKTFKSVMRELGIPMLSLQEIASGMKKVISYSYEYIKNLDKALTEISVVSGKTRSEVIQLTDTFIELSSKTGMAIDDIAQASTIFYQQGLDDEAVKKLTEYTAIFAKISNETVETAADQITAAINGFNFAADQAGDVIDKMSVLAAYSAADINELATAMSKGASQAAMAGLSFDQYNAYLATMIETTREAPENLGTSLKTIMSRFQNIKSGDNTEDDTDVNDVEKALKSVGVQLRDTEGQLRDLGDVLNDLGPKWNSLDRNTQAYLGTVIAGTRQQSRFVSLMQNWDRALELTAASENSAGAAARMHQAAMEGLDASLNNLTNAWQKLISNLANGDSFKWLIDALAGIVKWFSDGNTLLKVFTIGITLFNAKTLMANMALAAQGEKIKNLDQAFLGISGRLKTLGQNFISIGKETSALTQKIDEEKVKVDSLTQSYEQLTNAKKGASNAYNSADPDGSSVPNSSNNEGGKTTQVSLPNKKALDELGESVDNVDKKNKKWNWSLKTAGKNITNLIGKVQTGLMVSSLIMTAASTVKDWLTTTSDEIREKAQEAYDETQKEIDKRTELIKSVEANADIYDKLSKKLNKSTEEIEQLADAANELAKAVPGALIGYDANGNAIINTNQARADVKDAKQELADYAKDQMANIGNLARADLKEQAEKNYAVSDAGKVNNAVQIGSGVTFAAATTTAAAVAGTNFWNPVGWAALAVAAVSAVAWGISSLSEQANISAEELALAEKKAKEVSENYAEDMLKNMSYITDNAITNRTIDSVSKEDRHALASYIGNEWLNKRQQEIYQESFNDKGKFDAEAYEEAYKNLGNDWEEVLDQVNDRILAKASKKINELMDDIGNKSYKTVEEAINKIIKSDMGISEDDPLFKTLKTAFFKAAYSGTDLALYNILTDLEKRRDEAKEKFGEDSNQTKAYNTAINSAKNMNGEEVQFYDDIGVFNNVGMFNMVISQYGDTIRQGLAKSTEAACVNSIAILANFRDQANAKLEELAREVGVSSVDEIDYDSLTQEQKSNYDKWTELAEDAAASVESAWNNMKISIDIPWKTLWDDFEKLEERALHARETLVGMLSEDGIDKNTWKDFTEQLDSIDFSNFNIEQLDQYSNALDNIAESLKVVDGQIYANGEAIQTVAQLEEAAMQASIQSTKVELINKQLELEASKAIIDAQIATLEWKIKEAEGSAEASQYKANAEKAWGVASDKINTVYLQNQGKVAEALVQQFGNAFTEIATKYNQLQTAMADGSITQDEINKLQKEWKNMTEDLTFEAYNSQLDSAGYSVEQLREQLTAAKKVSSEYGWQISNINLKLAQLDSGLWGGANGVASGKKKEELEQYIGKLQKIYNIENRILTLEHRLSTLDAYEDIAQGSTAADFLGEQINLTNELLNQYAFLTQEQKRFTNGVQEDIKNAGFGNVFSFDKFGQIIINWEEYNKLQDTAVQGQKSLKEQADEWYEKQTDYIEKTREDFDKYVDTLQKALDLQNKIYDNYIDMENKAADAVKEIYQKILDTKLEAIDKEKEALEELRDAREKARTDQQNAKEISNLQTNIQRTMMDTSGASDISFIKAQQDMNDKLEEIADDKYSEMLDNIIERLEQEKETLQKEFDELWENMDWLFSWLDEEVMRDKDRLTELLTKTSEWNTSSQAHRNRLMQEWDTKYQSYMKALQGNKTIQDVWQNILNLQNETVKMDNILKQTISYTGNQIATAVGQAVSDAYNSGYIAGSDNNGGGGSKDLTPIKPTDDISPTGNVDMYVDTTPESAFKVGDKVASAEQRKDGGLNWVKTYKGIENGSVKGAAPVAGWPSSISGFSKSDTEIVKVKNVNGTNYYLIKGLESQKRWFNGHQLTPYKQGGLSYETGPAWLDGTSSKPEAVLNALQTEHFIKFTNALDNMFGNGNMTNTSSSVNIENISFNVESMSSPEDGEMAFNAFVNKFKEIGSQTGIKINSFKNTL